MNLQWNIPFRYKVQGSFYFFLFLSFSSKAVFLTACGFKLSMSECSQPSKALSSHNRVPLSMKTTLRFVWSLTPHTEMTPCMHNHDYALVAHVHSYFLHCYWLCLPPMWMPSSLYLLPLIEYPLLIQPTAWLPSLPLLALSLNVMTSTCQSLISNVSLLLCIYMLCSSFCCNFPSLASCALLDVRAHLGSDIAIWALVHLPSQTLPTVATFLALLHLIVLCSNFSRKKDRRANKRKRKMKRKICVFEFSTNCSLCYFF